MPRRKQSAVATQYWIGYCRKSTDSEDKQVHTLADQAAMIEEYYERLPAAERLSYGHLIGEVIRRITGLSDWPTSNTPAKGEQGVTALVG